MDNLRYMIKQSSLGLGGLAAATFGPMLTSVAMGRIASHKGKGYGTTLDKYLGDEDKFNEKAHEAGANSDIATIASIGSLPGVVSSYAAPMLPGGYIGPAVLGIGGAIAGGLYGMHKYKDKEQRLKKKLRELGPLQGA